MKFWLGVCVVGLWSAWLVAGGPVQPPKEQFLDFPDSILKGLSKRAAQDLLAKYKQARRDILELKRAREALVPECKDRLEGIKNATKSSYVEQRDEECLPCLQEKCAERMDQCLLDREPTCQEIEDAARVTDVAIAHDAGFVRVDGERTAAMLRLCGFYRRQFCGDGATFEFGESAGDDCVQRAKQACVERFELCAYEAAPQEEPSCEALRQANSSSDVARLCSFYRRLCPQGSSDVACRDYTKESCSNKIRSCLVATDDVRLEEVTSSDRDECKGDVSKFLCDVFNFGTDVQDFFESDVSTFFKTDMPEFAGDTFGEVRGFFERDVADFFKTDVTDFFEEDVSNFFKDDVRSFFKKDVGDTADHWYTSHVRPAAHDVRDFFQEDVTDFFQEDVRDFFAEDVSDFFTEDVKGFFERDVKDFFERDVARTASGAASDVKDFFETDVKDAFEDAGEELETFGKSAKAEIEKGAEKVGNFFKGLFGGRRRRRSVDEEAPFAPPTCEQMQQSRKAACRAYVDQCPGCDFAIRDHNIQEVTNISIACPELWAANTTYMEARARAEWLVARGVKPDTVLFTRLVVDRQEGGPDGLYGATAHVTLDRRPVEINVRVGMTKQDFDKSMPPLLSAVSERLEALRRE